MNDAFDEEVFSDYETMDNLNYEDVDQRERFMTNLVDNVDIQAARATYGEIDDELKEQLINDIYMKVDLIISRIGNDKVKLNLFVEFLEKMMHEFDVDNTASCASKAKDDALRENVEFFPPTGIWNKGCGTGKRLVGAPEKSTIKSKKPKRMCNQCRTMANHDSRNCPTRLSG